MATLMAAVVAGAQQSAPPLCSYEACSFRIAPRWNGLAAVRGSGEERANLYFLWPRDIGAAFADVSPSSRALDSALAYAQRAVARRKTAAVFTDAGILLLGSAAVIAGRRSSNRSAVYLVGAGAAAFAVSVPLQFSADDLLGKAVWWYNRQFAP